MRSSAITCKKLFREEIAQAWNIDRSEVIDNIYQCENGTLVLRPQHYDVPGWPPGEKRNIRRSCLTASTGEDGSMVHLTTQNSSAWSSWKAGVSANTKMNSNSSSFALAAHTEK